VCVPPLFLSSSFVFSTRVILVGARQSAAAVGACDFLPPSFEQVGAGIAHGAYIFCTSTTGACECLPSSI